MCFVYTVDPSIEKDVIMVSYRDISVLVSKEALTHKILQLLVIAIESTEPIGVQKGVCSQVKMR
jgi:hypothetical protein